MNVKKFMNILWAALFAVVQWLVVRPNGAALHAAVLELDLNRNRYKKKQSIPDNELPSKMLAFLHAFNDDDDDKLLFGAQEPNYYDHAFNDDTAESDGDERTEKCDGRDADFGR